VALLHLSEPLKINDHVRPICLPTRKMQTSIVEKPSEDEDSLVIAGWNRNLPDATSLRVAVASRDNCTLLWNSNNETKQEPNGLGDRFCALVGHGGITVK
jgi:hypothetical protein